MEENRCEMLCKVCGDKASGKHYGVPSCDGCRGFFKRSIRRYARNLDYVCKENGRCIVDVSRRNQCQACRFTKCLRVNMKRDAVQHERAPRSGTSMATARRGPSGIYHQGIPHVFHTATTNPYHTLLYPALYPFKPAMSTSTPHVAQFLTGSTEQVIASSTTSTTTTTIAKEDEVTSSEEVGSTSSNKISNESREESIDIPRLTPTVVTAVIPNYPVSSSSLLSAENVYESAAKLLFLAVKWVRTVPSFVQLSLRDQTILLEESWSELFILTAAQWNFTVEESFLIPLDVPRERRDILADETRRLKQLLTKCSVLQVDHSEYACLKAIVLFKGESAGLYEASRISALQEQTVAVLSERGVNRLGQLLLLLPPARGLCRSTLHELLFKPTVGDVNVERLLRDMIHATRTT